MPTYTQTQDEFSADAIDTVHINPSIMEGVNLYSGILGPHASVPISRYAPVYLITPSISGDDNIPSVLTCNTGVVSASPSPSYLFQWRSAGVNILGATNPTLLTDNSMDATEITCFVEAVNFLGTASGVSNGITVNVVEAVRVEEHTYAIITGLEQYEQQNLMIHRGNVITGLSVD